MPTELSTVIDRKDVKKTNRECLKVRDLVVFDYGLGLLGRVVADDHTTTEFEFGGEILFHLIQLGIQLLNLFIDLSMVKSELTNTHAHAASSYVLTFCLADQ